MPKLADLEALLREIQRQIEAAEEKAEDDLARQAEVNSAFKTELDALKQGNAPVSAWRIPLVLAQGIANDPKSRLLLIGGCLACIILGMLCLTSLLEAHPELAALLLG